MDKFNYYIEALKKYAKFDGRANLPQFWYFILFGFVISFILSLINKTIGGLYGLAVLIPSLAIGARRLHDIGKSGWMQLVALIPFAGIIWLIILFAKKGDVGGNNYGEPALETEKSLKGDSKLEKEIEKFTDKVEDLAGKAGDKIEGIVEDLTEKVDSNK